MNLGFDPCNPGDHGLSGFAPPCTTPSYNSKFSYGPKYFPYLLYGMYSLHFCPPLLPLGWDMGQIPLHIPNAWSTRQIPFS